jgi:hypothetical protein
VSPFDLIDSLMIGLPAIFIAAMLARHVRRRCREAREAQAQREAELAEAQSWMATEEGREWAAIVNAIEDTGGRP